MDFKEELNKAFRKRLARRYDTVFVLCVYWEHTDDQKFKKEASDVSDLFSEHFKFKTAIYSIPSRATDPEEDCTLPVVSHISGRIHSEYNGQGSLFILHYGGHGDIGPDTRGLGKNPGLVWAARRSRGPTAFWPEVEALFLRAKQDVLIVMDCCYSGQGGRAQKFTKTNHIEIFASCHNYGEANAPGPHSFTAHFIAETRRLLDHYRCVVTTSLFALLRQTINRQTPVHSSIDPLREPDQRTMIMGIQLQPLTEEDKDLTYMSEITATRFELSIDLSVSLDDDYMLKLINWLTTFRPQEVLRIEATSITHLKHRASLQGQLDFADVVNGCRSKMSQMNAPLRSPAIVPELPSMGFDSWSNDSSICPHPDQLTCQAPEGRNSTLVSLADIITGTGVNAPPSFEHRLGLAVTLGEKFRRGEVPDWGQQIVGSDSLLFSRNPGVETVDYSRPYFENNSAQEAAPSRLYLLELLEGESRKVVAYGIILLELGLWRLDTDIFPIRGMSVAEFENHVEDQMNWLKFHMGTQYHLAAKLCLAVADHAVQFHLTDDGKCHKAQDMLDKAIESLNSVRL